MKESIVKVPRDNSADYDFIAFSFDGKHSVEDFGIYRVSDGNRNSLELAPTLKDITADVAGSDGTYYLGTKHTQKIFNINFAFDTMTDNKKEELKKWLNTKEICDLWFAEEPYKVYSAKVTGQPRLNFIPFDSDEGRVYKGEGTVQFTCFYPYAHTPTYIEFEEESGELKYWDGKYYTSYQKFSNYQALKKAGVLPGQPNNAFGDLPYHFIAKLDNVESGGTNEGTVSSISVDDNGGMTLNISGNIERIDNEQNEVTIK